MAPVNLAPPDFSRTQRLVLLVDLHPLLADHNPSSYIAAVLSVSDRLLRFPPLSASLSAFKLFFSSLSALRSAAVLPRHLSTPSLSFNLHPQTLDSLSATLNTISSLAGIRNEPFSSRAAYAASSLIQLIHDYVWETEKDNMLGEYSSIDDQFIKIPSNLVILLSPVSQSVNNFVDYLEMRDFDEVYCAVKEAFALRDIHLCWVDVNSDALENEGAGIKKNECGDKLLNLRNCIEKMEWGFCSSNFIVLGSVLLPVGLIYPRIGVSFAFGTYAGIGKRKCTGKLSLEILDVHGVPLECKFCDLEFINLNCFHYTIKNGDIGNNTQSRGQLGLNGQDRFFPCLGEGKVELHVKSIHRYDEYETTGGSSEIFLVRETFHELGKNKTKSGNEFLDDRVLDMLHEEMGGGACTNQLPTWQMFLSFLHVKDCSACVSLSSSSGDPLMCCLKPLTSHLALLYIMDGSIVRNTRESVKTPDTHTESINESTTCGSQTSTSISGNCIQYRDGKMKKNQKNLYQKMTWSSFCKNSFEGSNLNLFEFYLARYEKSKRLKFLTCWMKQISKVNVDFLAALPGSKSVGELAADNTFSSEPVPAEDEAQPVSNPEISETFFSHLSEKMDHGLKSGMDLQNLAEHVVESSVRWLSCNLETQNKSKCQQSPGIPDDSWSEGVASKLIKQLLKSPKEMKKIQQDLESCSAESIVREFELQIFLCIEILRSAGALLGESRRKKLIKQICSMLEIVQYLVAGGIHGHVSLYDYVERTIRARYSDKLEDIVNQIYTEMDLLPFGDEEQSPSLLFNSEDSNQSWRDKYDTNEKIETNNIPHSLSTEESSQLPINSLDSPQKIRQDEYTQILNEAHERREQARRRAPFVGKARDLQRVWAPKLPKATKGKFGPVPNKSKEKKDREKGGYSSVVYETPMAGNKRARSGENGTVDKTRDGPGSSSVSKALFQDD